MRPDASHVDAVTQWLREHFPDAAIASDYIFDRSTTLFRIAPKSGKAPELEISDEAFEDVAPAQMLSDLENHGVQQRLAADPTLRIQYTRSRELAHHEFRVIDCDGPRYRVVRDSSHNVRIFDNHDRPLARTPKQMLVLTVSIFQRDVEKWRNDIRAWRDADQ